MIISKAVFFDRDGVLVEPIYKNGRSYAATKLKDYKIYNSAKSEINKLKKLGFKLIVITNQPDIANHKMSINTLYKMNYILKNKLCLDKIYFCKHSKFDLCECRKPNILNLLKAKKKFNIDFKKSFLIGDRKSDIEAGRRINCKTIYIDRNYTNEPKPKNFNFKCNNLIEAIDFICRK